MKYPICCCFSEINSRYYADRILLWIGQLMELTYAGCELHVFCDGNFLESKTLFERNNIKFHEFKRIGRNSIAVFQSYKRNFYEMCKMFSNGFTLIENDVILLNKTKLKNFIFKSGWYCGYSNKYNFIETAMMILNDNKLISEFINHYGGGEKFYESEVFENVLMNIGKNNNIFPNLVFKGERKEGSMLEISDFDYIAQAY